MKISENFDRWMFDYKEGNLSAADAEEFENFLIQHPEFEVDADAWDMAYIPSEEFSYPHAEKLEKKRRVAGWYYWSAAATLLLLISSTFYFSQNSQDFENAVSLHEHTSSQAVTTKSETNQDELSTRSERIFAELTAGNSPANNHSSGISSTSTITSAQIVGNNLSSATVGIGEDGTVTSDPRSFAGVSQLNLLEIENRKLSGQNNIGLYSGNPESKALSFDVTKKGSQKSGGSITALRKIYHRVERMLGYPVGLTNLHDPELLLPQSTLLSFNSAFTGGMLKPRLDINYRNQWLGSDQNSSELNVSFDKYSYGLRGGVGLLVNAQDYGYGKFGDYNVSVLYSPKLVVNRNFIIEPALKLTMGSLTANGDKLQANSSFEMDRGRILNTIGDNQMSGISKQWYKDYGLGVMINTKWFYAGFNSDNLSRHYENVYGNELSSPSKTPVKLSGIIGTDYVSKTKTMTYSPFVAYQQYGSEPEFWAGMNYRLGWMTVGGAVSTNKEFTASAGLKFDTFKLVYHYDYTESALTQTHFGSHNIGIRFNAKSKNQRLTH